MAKSSPGLRGLFLKKCPMKANMGHSFTALGSNPLGNGVDNKPHKAVSICSLQLLYLSQFLPITSWVEDQGGVLVRNPKFSFF